jgi:hypothetical protein
MDTCIENVNLWFYLRWQNGVSRESLIPRSYVPHSGVKCLVMGDPTLRPPLSLHARLHCCTNGPQ